MKKIIFKNCEFGIESADACETLYYGLDEIIDGGWVLTTAGNPITLNECEDAEDEETIKLVDRLIEEAEAGKRDSDEISEEDRAYLNEWLELCGIDERI